MPKQEFQCCICTTYVNEYGNNPDPFPGDRCCDDCNSRFVVPARVIRCGPIVLSTVRRFAVLGRVFVNVTEEVARETYAKRQAISKA